MAPFRLLRRARADLLDIADFTARRWGDPQAEAYLHALFAAFRRLAEEPQRRRRYVDVPGYFRALEGQHAIFYREAEGGILVVRVLHATMLPELHLPRRGQDDE